MMQNNQTSQSSNTLSRLLRKNILLSLIAIFLSSTAFVPATQADDMADLKKVLQSQVEMMTPELQKKVNALSTDTKMSLMAILAMHSRYSEKATLRQVMLEVLADYQTMVMGIMTDSTEMTADGARRLANHRIPVGGLLPYLGMDNINDERLSVLTTFNDSVEGNANKLADAAEKGDMATASELLGAISSGCVGCHAVFRTLPGKSDLLK